MFAPQPDLGWQTVEAHDRVLEHYIIPKALAHIPAMPFGEGEKIVPQLGPAPGRRGHEKPCLAEDSLPGKPGLNRLNPDGPQNRPVRPVDNAGHGVIHPAAFLDLAEGLHGAFRDIRETVGLKIGHEVPVQGLNVVLVREANAIGFLHGSVSVYGVDRPILDFVAEQNIADQIRNKNPRQWRAVDHDAGGIASAIP